MSTKTLTTRRVWLSAAYRRREVTHFGNVHGGCDRSYACVFMLLNAYERLVTIEVNGAPVTLPEGNTLLRCFQHLAPEDISYGPFCWNAHCGTCVIECDTGEGTRSHGALACQLIVREGMRVRTVKPMFGYCVRSLVSGEVEAR